MENAVDAIKMAFAMLVFALALSVAMYAFTVTSSAAKVISYTADESNDYRNLRLDSKTNYELKRAVRAETIIPTLYRYYKENFSVRIYDTILKGSTSNPALIQLFDVNVEGEVRNAARKRGTLSAKEQKLLNLYNDASKSTYLYEAPWMGDTTKYTKTRIDLFIYGEAAFIYVVFVDYRTSSLKPNLKTYLDNLNTDDNNNMTTSKIDSSIKVPKYVFFETFVKYSFTGDTISEGEGEGLETITGNKQTEDKIDIIYTFEKNPEAN